MIKQSKLSKICWAFVYLLPLIIGLLEMFVTGISGQGTVNSPLGAFDNFSIPVLNFEFFASSLFSNIIGNDVTYLDYYLGYLVVVSLFRIVWKVLVYLPDVIGKLIDRWSL